MEMRNTKGILSELEPVEVFRYFEEICSIPHGSTNTKQISDYLVNFAKELGLKYLQDESNNVIIWKKGSAGKENREPVLIQGHIDMVCEKEADCDIDFEKEGLDLEIQDGKIQARGTTLGGDDGIAVAYAMAVLASDSIEHPPIEAVFTVDEEIGMLGAEALDCSVLKGKKLLNIDSEEEGYLLVSCAGGICTTVELPLNREKKTGIALAIEVAGLQGGHSGTEINKGRGNASMILGRTLYQISENVDFSLVDMSGGSKDNAIPREAVATLIVDEEETVVKIQHLLDALSKVYAKEYEFTDKDISLQLTNKGEQTLEVISEQGKQHAIALLVNLPNGVQKMSFEIDGLVQTSLNLGILTTQEDKISYAFSVRSSVESEKQELVSRISCLAKSYGAAVETQGDYPAWEYKKDSVLREIMVEVYQEQYGEKPVVQALHAGLECGLFCGKIPELDCVSFGPDILDIHTPKEALDIESTKRTWKYIQGILAKL